MIGSGAWSALGAFSEALDYYVDLNLEKAGVSIVTHPWMGRDCNANVRVGITVSETSNPTTPLPLVLVSLLSISCLILAARLFRRIQYQYRPRNLMRETQVGVSFRHGFPVLEVSVGIWPLGR